MGVVRLIVILLPAFLLPRAVLPDRQILRPIDLLE